MIWVSAVEEPLLLLVTVDPVRSLFVRRVWGNERRFRLLPEEKRKSKKGRMIIRLVDKKKEMMMIPLCAKDVCIQRPEDQWPLQR